MRNPILREYVGELQRKRYKVQAKGGLSYIKGNGKPYFSLTMASWLDGREDCFGAAHNELVARWPELKPLADLHLSDIDGVPMHAAANAWYWLAGAAEPFRGRIKYNGGSGSSAKSEAECLRIFAGYVRISEAEAADLLKAFEAVYLTVPQYQRVYTDAGIKAVVEALNEWIEAQKPRWKREADECIASLGLVVYGDVWPVKEAA